MLVPAIDRLLEQANWRKDGLGVLVAGVGPGSFTGIRTGIVTARTLACALELPLIGLSKFECLASLVARPVGIILYCGATTYFAAAYTGDNSSQLTPLLPPAYLSVSELIDKLPATSTWLADEQALPALRSTLAELNVTAALEPLPEPENIACAQALLAWDRLSLSLPGAVDPKKLSEEYHWSRIEPLYLRGPSITLKK